MKMKADELRADKEKEERLAARRKELEDEDAGEQRADEKMELDLSGSSEKPAGAADLRRGPGLATAPRGSRPTAAEAVEISV